MGATESNSADETDHGQDSAPTSPTKYGSAKPSPGKLGLPDNSGLIVGVNTINYDFFRTEDVQHFTEEVRIVVESSSVFLPQLVEPVAHLLSSHCSVSHHSIHLSSLADLLPDKTRGLDDGQEQGENERDPEVVLSVFVIMFRILILVRLTLDIIFIAKIVWDVATAM